MRNIKDYMGNMGKNRARLRENVRDWWVYAVKATIRRGKDGRGVWHSCHMGKRQKEQYEGIFRERFWRSVGGGWRKWHEDDLELYRIVVLSLGRGVLNGLVHKVIAEKMQREREEAKMAEEKKGQGWFGGWFGGGAKKDVLVDNKITQEDIDKINELIKSASNNEDVIETPDWYQFMNLNIQQRFADFKFVLKKNFEYGRIGGTQGTHDFQESEFEGLTTPKGHGAYTSRSAYQENPNTIPWQEANQVNERIEFKISNVIIWVGVKTKGCKVKWAVEDLSVDYKENKYATPLNIFSPKRVFDPPTSEKPKKQSLVIEIPLPRAQSEEQSQFSKKRTSSIGEADSLGPLLRKSPALNPQPDQKPNYIEFALETCPTDSPEIDCQIKIIIKTSKILYLRKMMKTVVEIFAIETEN